MRRALRSWFRSARRARFNNAPTETRSKFHSRLRSPAKKIYPPQPGTMSATRTAFGKPRTAALDLLRPFEVRPLPRTSEKPHPFFPDRAPRELRVQPLR